MTRGGDAFCSAGILDTPGVENTRRKQEALHVLFTKKLINKKIGCYIF